MGGFVGCRLLRPLTDGDVAALRDVRGAGAEFLDAGKGVYIGQRDGQPIQQGSQDIAFDGTIHNSPELRQALEGRMMFRGQSEAEVVMKSWTRRGADALQHFDGLFAFALLDVQGNLHLAMDPFGGG